MGSNEKNKQTLTNYIPISRELFEHYLWCEERTYSRFEAWLYIIKEARFEDTKLLDRGKIVVVKRGQIYVSIRFLSNAFGWSTKKVMNFLRLLEEDNMIKKETLKETGQNIITISKYDRYNPPKRETETLGKHSENKWETEGIKKETLKETGQNITTISKYDRYKIINTEEETPKETLGKQQGNDKETKSKELKILNNTLYIGNEQKILSESLFKVLQSLLSDQYYLEMMCINSGIRDIEKLKEYLKIFFVEIETRGETYKDEPDAKHHFSSWLRLRLQVDAKNDSRQTYKHPSASYSGNTDKLKTDTRW